MSEISNVNRYNFYMEVPTQSIEKKVVIQQTKESLKISLLEKKSTFEFEKHMINGLPNINLIPREFFDCCSVKVMGESIYFVPRILGGMDGQDRSQNENMCNKRDKIMIEIKPSWTDPVFKFERDQGKDDCQDPSCKDSGRYVPENKNNEESGCILS